MVCKTAACAVVASEKGVVVGRLSYREDGDLIDCQRMGIGGKAIPPNVDKVCQAPFPGPSHPSAAIPLVAPNFRPPSISGMAASSLSWCRSV